MGLDCQTAREDNSLVELDFWKLKQLNKGESRREQGKEKIAGGGRASKGRGTFETRKRKQKRAFKKKRVEY